MTDQQYTPTTDDLELFKKIAQLRYSNEQLRPEERRRAFDHFEHMLNAIEAAAEQRGAERVLKYFQDHVNEVSEYSYIGAAIQELIVQASENRADQMEGDDETH